MRAELRAKAVKLTANLRERARLARRNAELRWERASRATRQARAELLTIAATLAGWALVTWGVSSLTRGPVWRFSAGLLLLSTCGWEFLAHIAWRGFYQLTRRRPDA